MKPIRDFEKNEYLEAGLKSIYMKKKTIYIVLLLLTLLFSVGIMLLIKETNILSGWKSDTVSLIVQYLKVLGFISFIGLVYLRLQKASSLRIEDQANDQEEL